MQAISVLNTPTLLAPAGNRDFIHIYNNSDSIIYICYDGGEGAAGVNLTTATGIPIPVGGVYFIDNIGPKNIFNKPVYAIAAASGKEVRVQGV